MNIGQAVRQTLHLRDVARPETREPGEVPGSLQQQLHPLVVKTNPRVQTPSGADFKVLSFNVRLGGQDFAGVQRTILAKAPDVVALQECSRATAERIAKAGGYHLAFFSSPRHNNSTENGRAILSRFPIQEAESRPYQVPVRERLGNMLAHIRNGEGSLWQRIAGSVSLWQKRTLLRTTLRIGGKTVDMLDTHLTTGAPATAARQYDQLRAYVAERKRLGHEIILAGDFNTRNPAAPLEGELTDSYAGAADVAIIGLDGRVLSPRAAQARLQAPGLSAGERALLQRMAIGATLASGSSRIDAILASDGLKATRLEIDQQNDASDHEPLLATYAVQP